MERDICCISVWAFRALYYSTDAQGGCVYKSSLPLSPLPLSLPPSSLTFLLSKPKAPIVILGNKRDLNAIREVESGKASQQCKAHGLKFYEVTVLDRDGLKDPMCYMAWRMANPGRWVYN